MSEIKHCICCGMSHEGKTCPPKAFSVMSCINCGNEIVMSNDAVGYSRDMTCGDCQFSLWQIRPATYDDMIKSNKDYGKFCINMRAFDLRKINSATKYPSILTYHALGEKGCLREEVLVPFDDNDEISISEKIDGTNARIILFPKGMYLIGSREEILHGQGDWIYNTTLDIVDAIRNIADNARRMFWDELDQSVYILFGEVYGGKTTSNSKNYTNSGKLGFRLFDVVTMNAKEFEDILDMPIEKIAAWRDNGGQHFVDQASILQMATKIGCNVVQTVETVKPPERIKETYDWLKLILPGQTLVSLDAGHAGKPEGVVIRTFNRSKIAKIRFEDYERTIRKLSQETLKFSKNNLTEGENYVVTP